eukprot:110843-Chlamydomonas_euryale.AAC.2
MPTAACTAATAAAAIAPGTSRSSAYIDSPGAASRAAPLPPTLAADASAALAAAPIWRCMPASQPPQPQLSSRGSLSLMSVPAPAQGSTAVRVHASAPAPLLLAMLARPSPPPPPASEPAPGKPMASPPSAPAAAPVAGAVGASSTTPCGGSPSAASSASHDASMRGSGSGASFTRKTSRSVVLRWRSMCCKHVHASRGGDSAALEVHVLRARACERRRGQCSVGGKRAARTCVRAEAGMLRPALASAKCLSRALLAVSTPKHGTLHTVACSTLPLT